MALRAFSKQLGSLITSTSGRCSFATPTVFDKMVQFFVIDKSGTRHTVRGLEGESLAQALREYGKFPDEVFMPHPFDPAAPDCHVYVGGDYVTKLASLSEEQIAAQERVLENYVRHKARNNSRMAYFIPLSPSLNGMTVALGEMEPWQTQ